MQLENIIRRSITEYSELRSNEATERPSRQASEKHSHTMEQYTQRPLGAARTIAPRMMSWLWYHHRDRPSQRGLGISLLFLHL